jgi:hypothetical protein
LDSETGTGAGNEGTLQFESRSSEEVKLKVWQQKEHCLSVGLGYRVFDHAHWFYVVRIMDFPFLSDCYPLLSYYIAIKLCQFLLDGIPVGFHYINEDVWWWSLSSVS